MSDRQGIEIDYCPQCRGVWLDRGELDKIIERTVLPQAPAPEPRKAQLEQRGRDDYRGGDARYNDKRHRKRSSLFDLFDFD
jgi:Zn-finger nucleic acid-binding protein